MKYNKISELVFFGLLLAFIIELQASSQECPLSPKTTIRKTVVSIVEESITQATENLTEISLKDSGVPQTSPEAMQGKFVVDFIESDHFRAPQKRIKHGRYYSVDHTDVAIKLANNQYDVDVIKFWTINKIFQIKEQEKVLHLPENQILYEVIAVDNHLRELKKSVIAQNHQNYHAWENGRWLQYLYKHKDEIEMLVDKGKLAYSYQAWPYIKEIHTIRNLNSSWNANNNYVEFFDEKTI